MRKADREIKDRNEIIEVIKRTDVCRLGLIDKDGTPYILPLNFGFEADEKEMHIYFHSALEGYKLELMEADPRASFEMDGKHQLQYFEEKGYCTYAYESVMGKGRITFIEDPEEVVHALELLMDHYHPGQKAWFNPAAIPRTKVYRLDVTEITGKRKLPK